jgi:hypothetical protein
MLHLEQAYAIAGLVKVDSCSEALGVMNLEWPGHVIAAIVCMAKRLDLSRPTRVYPRHRKILYLHTSRIVLGIITNCTMTSLPLGSHQTRCDFKENEARHRS